MLTKSNLTVEEGLAISAIVLAEQLVMQIAGGNLDHPALDRLEQAQGEVYAIAARRVRDTRAGGNDAS